MPTVTVRPELRLLAACTLRPAAAQIASWREAIAVLIGQVTDWPAVLALVRRQQVYVLASEALCDLPGGASAPAEIVVQLEAQARRSRLDGLLRVAEARRVAERLQRAGIPGVQIKGAPLSQRLYGDALMRHSTDIDVLVSPMVLSEVMQLLVGLGYSADQHMPQAHGLHSRMQRRAYHHCVLRSRDNVQLELHWRLGAWNEAHTHRLVNESVADATTGLRVLPQAVELAYLVAHGTGHYWMRLKWLSDIKQALLTAPASLWPAFTEESLAAGVQHAVEVTRCVLAWIFDTPSPELPKGAAPPQARHVRSARYALYRMQAPLGHEHGLRSAFERTRYRLDCSTPDDKIAAALRCVDTVSRFATRHS